MIISGQEGAAMNTTKQPNNNRRTDEIHRQPADNRTEPHKGEPVPVYDIIADIVADLQAKARGEE